MFSKLTSYFFWALPSHTACLFIGSLVKNSHAKLLSPQSVSTPFLTYTLSISSKYDSMAFLISLAVARSLLVFCDA